MSDPQKYRSKEEVSKIRAEHDPIDRVRDRLLEDRLANEEQLKEIDKEVRAVVNDAAEFAQNCPEPASAELFADVYA